MREIRTIATISAIAAIAALATPLAAQQSASGSNDNTFDWSGAIPAGSWLRIANLNGSIEVEPASGNTAQVHGEKKWREGDPSRVRFVVAKDGDNVTVCALWNEDDSCDEDGYHSHGHHGDNDHNDVSVKFTVQLPKGVRVATNTVNGSLDISGASAEVVAHTVNGRIDAASTSGPVDAETVNGSIHVRMDAIPTDTGELEFSSVNGSVTIEVPSIFAGELEMETVNGSLQSDFPVTMQGRFNPRHLRAKIGEGGPTIRLKTVNGSVELKKLS
jgi:hypothetical protein